ncbi:MAG: hypothetical protein AAB225_14155 [Acidobacteriota bacterium]
MSSNRRQFVGSFAAGAALPAGQGVTEKARRIGVGLIGCGARGSHLAQTTRQLKEAGGPAGIVAEAQYKTGQRRLRYHHRREERRPGGPTRFEIPVVSAHRLTSSEAANPLRQGFAARPGENPATAGRPMAANAKYCRPVEDGVY